MNAWLKRCVFNLDLNRESVSEPRHKGTELNMLPTVIKGMVHPKIVFLSLFTHSHVVPYLY